MKRFILYILLFTFVADTTHLCQLAKIPALYRHFTEHKDLNNNLSFVGFLSMHYWGQDLNDQDDEKDMQLPFKKIDHPAPAFIFLPVQKIIPVVRQDFYWYVRKDYQCEQRDDHVNPAIETLFRPPRV